MSTDRRDLYNGFGDTYARAFEIVVTPGVFGLIGWFLDARFGTFPLLALALGVAVFLYELWKLSRGYIGRMDEETRKALRRD